MQTADYAAAVMGEIPAADLGARVTMRVGRRDVLMRDDAPEFTALISEHVLHEPLGGTAALIEQLRHIVKMAKLPNVAVQVVPSGTTTWNPAHAGSFLVFEFPKAAPIVHLEHLASSMFIYSAREARAYREAITTLLEVAMSPIRSVELIASMADNLEGKRP
ncbi:DUF5753 domain-containing protein [Saccharopolyspora sp. CA-218241]|uniref:DUF5753 domain-containing protein n=1 Tax=Saccharopolyspora sp. CA-218241 TaxID=3240027 RepID=UPI003D994280